MINRNKKEDNKMEHNNTRSGIKNKHEKDNECTMNFCTERKCCGYEQ